MRTLHFTPKHLIPTIFVGAIVFASFISVLIRTENGAGHIAHAAAPDNTAVTTFHNDNLRTGQNLNETILTMSNVNSNQFGKRVSYPVDGQIYAQPLFVPGVTINGATHNVVYVATEGDSVYAFDADQTTAVAPLWHISFVNGSDVTTVPPGDVYSKYPNNDITPQIGITGTPVIDTSTGTLYVSAMTKENGQYVHRLHALDVATGQDKPGSSIVIEATVSGTGYDNSNGTISFNSKEENQRSALLLSNGVVYISWAGFGDTDPYHGWIMGYSYDGTTLRQVSVYNDTANGQEGGIWMSGAGPSADASGNVYLTTGNGTYDLNNNGPDAGDSFVKLDTQNGLSLSDYFTPFNQSCLDGRDADLGSGGSLLLPDQTGTAHPHLLVGIGKEGRVYVVDRDNMGKFTSDPNLACNTSEENRTDIDKVVQELPPGTTGSLFGITGYWGGTADSGQLLYVGGYNDNLRALQLNNDTVSTSATSKTAETFAFSGATPSISSNGNTAGTGIVWVNSPSSCASPGCTPSGSGALRAYDATDLGKELYNSEQNPDRDRVDSYVKFSVPTVANGEVFVGTQTSLSIYGLLDTQQPSPTTTVDDREQGTGQNQFNYVGNWGHCTDCNNKNEGMYNASNSWSNTADDTATITFTGTQINFYGVKRPIHGIAAISIDGGSETLIDFYSATDAGDQLMWSSPTLQVGTHTLKIRVTATKNPDSADSYVAIDRVVITSS